MLAEVACLAGIIFAEARGEPLVGQFLVGMTVMNRTAHEDFPKDICGVVHQPGQFTSIRYIDRNTSSYELALAVATLLHDGYTADADGVIYFYNPKHASPDWASRMTVVQEVGGHLFLKDKK